MLWLITQILFCLLLAGLLGLFLGWLIWGRRADSVTSPSAEPVAQADTTALDAATVRIHELERDLADCRAAAPVSSAAPVVEVGSYGLFGPVAKQPIDDLKVISGIGPVIETQLANIGVVTYRQIADFDDDDIGRVQEAIDFFPGRIVREGWTDQAEALHKEKYGSAG